MAFIPQCSPTSHQKDASLPEAPISMNVHVDAPGLGKVQVTARGTDPAAVASQLRASVTILQGHDPMPELTREQRVGLLLAKGIACAVTKDDMSLAERLAKAAYLVMSGAVEPTETPGVMAVRSQADPLTWYEVNVETNACTCPAWVHTARAGAAKPCKHALATQMYTRLEAHHG